jgi:YfiR/HmsC-like
VAAQWRRFRRADLYAFDSSPARPSRSTGWCSAPRTPAPCRYAGALTSSSPSGGSARATAIVCLLGAAATAFAAPPRTSPEYEVKAAFIYNFAKFVEWPSPSASDVPFVVTVLGADPFGQALEDALRDKSVQGRRIVLRRAATIGDVGASQILFISDSEQPALASILKQLASDPVLTVGDMGQFAAHGGVIGFRLEGDRIRLDISLAAAERSGLRLSSQLLRIARIVGAGDR